MFEVEDKSVYYFSELSDDKKEVIIQKYVDYIFFQMKYEDYLYDLYTRFLHENFHYDITRVMKLHYEDNIKSRTQVSLKLETSDAKIIKRIIMEAFDLNPFEYITFDDIEKIKSIDIKIKYGEFFFKSDYNFEYLQTKAEEEIRYRIAQYFGSRLRNIYQMINNAIFDFTSDGYFNQILFSQNIWFDKYGYEIEESFYEKYKEQFDEICMQ